MRPHAVFQRKEIAPGLRQLGEAIQQWMEDGRRKSGIGNPNFVADHK
jgi:hypothetical protein